jgi:hypothetical protein
MAKPKNKTELLPVTMDWAIKKLKIHEKTYAK